MEWRCEWCGKPHEENDPPCENCGHGSFEKAVVRQTDLAEQETKAALVWVCTDCGREHPKHAPPCSRCGNPDLEKQRQQLDETELDAPGYLDLLTPKYAVALVATLLFAAVVILGFAGVIDLPGMNTQDVLEVENVPGNATYVGDIPLTAVEAAYLEEINELRETNDLPPLDRSTKLDQNARSFNQKRIVDGVPSEQKLGELLDSECNLRQPVASLWTEIDYDADADAATLGERLATQTIEKYSWDGDSPGQKTGIDVHSANGQLYITQFVCQAAS